MAERVDLERALRQLGAYAWNVGPDCKACCEPMTVARSDTSWGCAKCGVVYSSAIARTCYTWERCVDEGLFAGPPAVVTPKQSGSVKESILDKLDRVSRDVQKAAKPSVAQLQKAADRAFRFFAGLNIQDYPRDVQKQYLEAISELRVALKGPGSYL